MAAIKRVILLLLPPVVAIGLKRIRDYLSGAQTTVETDEEPEWEIATDCDEVWNTGGWGHPSIGATLKQKWPGFLASTEDGRPFGVSHLAAGYSGVELGAHNGIVTFGYVLGRVAADCGKFSVLDWGGGIGHYYIYSQRLYPGLDIEYVVKELPHLCEVGRELLPSVSFVDNDTSALSRQYDLVFASGSLQYEQRLYDLLERLCRSSAKWLFLTRLPILEEHDDLVAVQRAHRHGYLTSFVCWFVNRSRLMRFMDERQFVLEREFFVAEAPNVYGAPEQARFCGFLFRRRDDAGGISGQQMGA